MFATIWKLLDLLTPKAKLHFGLLAIPMLVLSVLEMMSIGMILPIIQILIQGKSIAESFGPYAKYLPSVEIDAGWVIGGTIALFIFKNAAILATMYLVSRVVQMNAASFLTTMYELYLARPIVYHYRNNSSALLRNLMSGSWRTFQTFQIILSTALDLCLMLAVFLTLLIVAPWITLASGFVLGAVGGIFHLSAGRYLHRWGEMAMINEGEMIKWINQTLSGVRDIKLTQTYRYMADRVRERANLFAFFFAQSSTVLQVPRLLIEVVIITTALLIVLFLSHSNGQTENAVSVLGLFGLASMRLMPSLNRVLANASDIKLRAAFIDSVHRDLVEGRIDSDLAGSSDSTIATDLTFEREISLSNIAYRYEGLENHALNHISLTIKKGEAIGIVGASGAGKSTLIDIILGFLAPSSGTFSVDGIDIKANSAGWQKRIGYVPQQINLFDDSLIRNIAFGIADERIDLERVRKTLQIARLDEFVASLPDGLDTFVGERGVRLSGGQRQRIAIARALYRDPEVLIFDEATAALDNETEKEVTDAIEMLSGQKTILIIAHRLSTVVNCNRIILMDKGQIAATGSFDQLAATNQIFKKFARLE